MTAEDRASEDHPADERTTTPLRALCAALRPEQYVKNLACAAGLIFSGRLLETKMQLRTLLACVAFSAAASVVYLVNDFLDRERDLRNPRTAQRPLARGTLPHAWAAGAAIVLLVAALAIAFSLGLKCVTVVVGYFALNLAYSLGLKQLVVVDVVCIALGFVARVLFGVFAVEVLPTPWIVACMFALAMFLGFGKRRAEQAAMGSDASAARPVLAKYSERGLDAAMGLSAALSVAMYVLYCLVPQHPTALLATIAPVVYCIGRYAYLVIVGRGGQRPERVLFGDKSLWMAILVWIGLVVFALYGHNSN